MRIIAGSHKGRRLVAPKGLDTYGSAAKPSKSKRDVFIYFISGAKVRAPHAAMAMIGRLK